MYDIKFEESGLLAEFFGFGKVQLESSTKYICKYFVAGLMHFFLLQSGQFVSFFCALFISVFVLFCIYLVDLI